MSAAIRPAFSDVGGGGSISRILAAMRYVKDSYQAYDDGKAKMGDPWQTRMPDGDFWCTGRPDMIKEIFAAPLDLFDDPVSPQILAPILGAGSLILLGGQEHKSDRRLMMPPFHGERMRAYASVVRRATLERLAPGEQSGEVSLLAVNQEISLDVILEAIFGVNSGERDRFEAAILATIDGFTPTLMMLDFLQRPFFGPWRRFLKAKAGLDRLIEQLIDTRRQEAGERDDILSLLLGAEYSDGTKMSVSRLKDELMTMLMAGHETSAIAMTWAAHYVLADPHMYERLMAELQSVDLSDVQAVTTLPYLGAICSESMRLHPVVPDISRSLKRDHTFAGQPMKKGDQILVVMGMLHRDPELYPEPDAFRPERFLQRQFAPHEYAPFGGGNRRCLGAAFATYEMKLALATLFSSYEMSLLDPEPPVRIRRNVTMGPSHGVRVSLTRRAPHDVS